MEGGKGSVGWGLWGVFSVAMLSFSLHFVNTVFLFLLFAGNKSSCFDQIHIFSFRMEHHVRILHHDCCETAVA